MCFFKWVPSYGLRFGFILRKWNWMGTGKLIMPYLLIIVLPHTFSITKLYRLANMVNHDFGNITN